MVEKVLRIVSSKFDYVVAAIEECKDIEHLKIEELQGTLEAHELKMVNKIVEKAKEEQALQAQMSNMGHSSRGRWKKNNSSGRFSKGGRSANQDLASSEGKSESSDKTNKDGFSGRGRGGKKVQDLRKIQCYNCEKWGHYATYCWHGKGKQKRESGLEANVA